MTIWTPDLDQYAGPRYRAIADALADDISSGGLKAGLRLPTHRDLAEALSVTVGTVSRAYAEAERRGLVKGEVGRGTFVRSLALPGRGAESESQPKQLLQSWNDSVDASWPAPPEGKHRIGYDLRLSVPACPSGSAPERALSKAFHRLGDLSNLGDLLAKSSSKGAWLHRQAGAKWAACFGMRVDPDRVLVTCGAQHALTVVLATLTRPGDVLMTEELTYPGMRALAATLRLRLHGIPMDEEGLSPEAFEEACRSGESRLLYCTPTVQNPLSTVMPLQRRREIAGIARSHGVSVIEDDVYGFLPRQRPPALTSEFENGYYLLGVSKLVAASLRVGFLCVPEGMTERLGSTLWATTWLAPRASAEIISNWIEDGTLEKFVEWRREEAEERMRLAAAILPQELLVAHPAGLHVWLRLPSPWRADDFVRQAASRGVAVAPAESFMAGRTPAPHSVRVSLSAEKSRSRLEEALGILSELLAQLPGPSLCVV